MEANTIVSCTNSKLYRVADNERVNVISTPLNRLHVCKLILAFSVKFRYVYVFVVCFLLLQADDWNPKHSLNILQAVVS
jgi:Trk-type K+ transport system membrane component